MIKIVNLDNLSSYQGFLFASKPTNTIVHCNLINLFWTLMIGLIEGKVLHLSAPVAIVLTNSGIGYEIELPVPAFCQLQMDTVVKIWTHLHVREDAQLLYGFTEYQERDVFKQLIKINGVGAKIALAMLSSMSSAQLKSCVNNQDESALVKVPGIGKKTAQRLLIELKDKLKNIEAVDADIVVDNENAPSMNHEMKILAEVEAALMSLGYKEKEAQQAIKLANQAFDEPVDIQTLLKASLKQLA